MAEEPKLSTQQLTVISNILHGYLLAQTHRKGARAKVAEAAGLREVYQASARVAANLAAITNKEKRESTIANGARKIVDNFITHATPQGAVELRGYLEKLYLNDDESLGPVPDYIKVGLLDLFGPRLTPGQPDVPAPVPAEQSGDAYAAVQVIAAIRNDNARSLKKISEAYRGLWWIIRYSAHLAPGERPKKAGENEWDAWVVLTAMEIGTRDPQRGHDDAPFTLKYRAFKKKDEHTITGSILSIHNSHVLFFGHEHDSDYPLFIFAPRHAEAASSFPGMVLRRHYEGSIFCTRVMFVRATPQVAAGENTSGEAAREPTLSDLTTDIGGYLESKLKEKFEGRIDDIDGILAQVKNTIDYGGKSGLILDPERDHEDEMEDDPAIPRPVRPRPRPPRPRR